MITIDKNQINKLLIILVLSILKFKSVGCQQKITHIKTFIRFLFVYLFNQKKMILWKRRNIKKGKSTVRFTQDR